MERKKRYVGFIERFESELERLLLSGRTSEDIVKWTSDKVFESYRNGVEVGKNGRKGGARPKAEPVEAE